ncbi:O-antigen ligase family protein [Gorillibacterium sp. sgz500922]|uniref:O-antigen ligase family protein n=1 Tax=Gorillibacterium sp. sgz500922 TaxID=3446694 RepID=UPI003F6731E3
MSSSKKRPGPAKAREQVGSSLLYWGIMLFCVGFLLIAPFSKALFQSTHNEFNYAIGINFLAPINTALVFTFIGLLMLAGFYYFFFSIRRKADYLLLLIWLIPLCYGIGLFRGVSYFSSLQSFYVQLMLASFFLFGAALVRYRKGTALLVHGIMASGYGIVIFGILVWLGMLANKGYVVNDGTGTRLTSVFTYANSYAGYLGALILAMLYLSATSKRKGLTVLHAFFLVPAMVSLLLTLSRGGWVLLPVLFIVILPFVRLAGQIAMTLQLLVSGLAAMALSSYVTGKGMDLMANYDSGTALVTLLLLLAVSAAVAGLALAIRFFCDKYIANGAFFQKLRYSNLWFPLAVTVLGGLLLVLLFSTPLIHILPADLQNRFENINFNQHSVRERGYFYGDSWKIAKDYLGFGTGGGGWTNLYHQYQSYPYTSRQAHNFLFQVLIDIGLVGTAITFLFMAVVFVLFIRRFMKEHASNSMALVFFILALSLLAHSFIDFDMSYAFLGALLYLCLGALLAVSSGEDPERENPAMSGGGAFLNRFRWLYPSALGILALVMIVVGFQATLASNKGQAAVAALRESQVDLQRTQKLLKDAVNNQKSNVDYQLMQVDLYSQAYMQMKDASYLTAAQAILNRLDKKEPSLIEPYEYRYGWAMQSGKTDQALPLAEEMLRRNPWNAVYYERAIELRTAFGEQSRQAGKASEANQQWDQAMAWYQELQNRIARQNEIPKEITIGNPLTITRGVALPLARIEYNRGDYAKVEEQLKPFLSEGLEDAEAMDTARYYAAALAKQGNPDRTWQDKLIAKDAGEQAKLDALLKIEPMK